MRVPFVVGWLIAGVTKFKKELGLKSRGYFK
jgi:hypothetical protein